MQTLLERTTAGFNVRLDYCPLTRGLYLSGVTELHSSVVAIAPESASNAFEHPCCYLESPALFFKAEPQGEGEQEEHTSEKGYENLMDAIDDISEHELRDFKEYGGEVNNEISNEIDNEEDGA